MRQPARNCWPEIWHIIGPLVMAPYMGGPATWMDDLFVEINRHGFVEETHFTVAYSPVPDETVADGIGGVLATVHEITQQVVQQRRVVVLRDLGARAMEAKTAEEACGIAARTFAQHAKDVPFALIYPDTGEGISQDVLPHIFERFWQRDSPSTRRAGRLGLGLAIVRHIVELHHGSVRAESAGPGRGAVFTVELPLTGDPRAPAA